MSKFLALACLFLYGTLAAQDVSINNGWKFKTGDQPGWAAPSLNDSSWAPIKTGEAWELQDYPNYDGYAWYRLHIVIPSSIKAKAFLKERMRIDLGKIDDGDEVYLNGSLIGRNGNRGGTIETQGNWDLPRSYSLSLNDSRIHWDKDNVIAVRVWDHEGQGGLFEGPYGITINDVTDFVRIDASGSFQFASNKQVSKKLSLQSLNDKYDFTGKLHIAVTDLVTGAVVFKQTLGIDFARDRPFAYTYKMTLPENKPYQAVYTFDEARSGKPVSLAEGVPYILTPKAPATPRINGPEIFGVRPGSPFLYRIPATGEAPIAYSVTGLPATLKLDPQTGIITGTLPQKGSYKLRLAAKNKLGTGSKDFTVICGDKTGLTPALGWNSWNCWGLTVNDEKVKASAKTMSEKLAAYGWTYINIDDGWEDKRDAAGVILPNKKFPDMKSLAGYVHDLGLKIGIYSSPGPRTCGGFLGSYQHEQQDAASYAGWGIDYLKYDWCSYSGIAPQTPSLEEYKKPYKVMQQALEGSGRDIIYSLCQYGMGDVWKWGGEVGANSWRTTGDITDTWGSMSSIGFKQDNCAPYTEPGHFNDPDMLVVGKVGWGPSLHDSRLTPDEQYTHISLWSLLSAPLLIGCDMSRLDDFTLGLLTNAEVLAVDQDALAKPASRLIDKEHIQVWIKELKDGSKAVGIFNLDDKPARTTLAFKDLKLPARLKLRDAWRQQDLPVANGSYTASLPAHGCMLLKVKAAL